MQALVGVATARYARGHDKTRPHYRRRTRWIRSRLAMRVARRAGRAA